MAKNKEIEYAFKPGSCIPKSIDPQVVGEHLEKLRLRNNDRLTTPVILKDASDPDSPIHDVFQWDDTKAAHEFRLVQARNMTNHLVVVRIKSELFDDLPSHISIRVGGESYYAPIQDVRTKTEIRDHAIDNAMRDLATFDKKYREIKKFAGVRREILRLRVG